MSSIAEATQNAIDLMERHDLLETGEHLTAMMWSSNEDTITLQMGERNYILFEYKKDTGILTFPYNWIFEEMNMRGYNERSFSDPTGAEQERFLSTLDIMLSGLRRGDKARTERERANRLSSPL